MALQNSVAFRGYVRGLHLHTYIFLLAGLPLILTYDGPTRIITAGFITTMIPVLPPVIWLGYFYHVCLMLSIVFCSNSINIYAGINGLEVGQSIVVAMAQLIYSSLVRKNSSPWEF